MKSTFSAPQWRADLPTPQGIRSQAVRDWGARNRYLPMTSATIDASADTSGTGDHSPVLRSDEEGTMHTLTEATCGTSPDVAAVTLEFTGVTIVDDVATQDGKSSSDGLATVHVITQETQLDVGILEQAADDQQVRTR